MTKIRKNSGFTIINENQYKFFSKWYYAVVREVASMINWQDDFTLLAFLIKPKISKQEAKEAIDFLIHSNMLVKNSDCTYFMIDEFITDIDVPILHTRKSKEGNLKTWH